MEWRSFDSPISHADGPTPLRSLIALELLPFAALAAAFAIGIVLTPWYSAWPLVILPLATTALTGGLGWMRAGRVGVGLALSLLRVAACALLVVYEWHAFTRVLCESPRCLTDDPFIPPAVALGLLAAVFVAPLVSASALAFLWRPHPDAVA